MYEKFIEKKKKFLTNLIKSVRSILLLIIISPKLIRHKVCGMRMYSNLVIAYEL